jgi:hypothetical protein
MSFPLIWSCKHLCAMLIICVAGRKHRRRVASRRKHVRSVVMSCLSGERKAQLLFFGEWEGAATGGVACIAASSRAIVLVRAAWGPHRYPGLTVLWNPPVLHTIFFKKNEFSTWFSFLWKGKLYNCLVHRVCLWVQRFYWNGVIVYRNPDRFLATTFYRTLQQC